MLVGGSHTKAGETSNNVPLGRYLLATFRVPVTRSQRVKTFGGASSPCSGFGGAARVAPSAEFEHPILWPSRY